MFYRLILAHLVGDFVLQTRWLVARKRSARGLAIHVGLVGLAMLPVAWDRIGTWWPWLLAILAVHGATDWVKVHLESRLLRLPPILPFLVDQAVHVLIILAVSALAEPGGLGLAWPGRELVWWIASVYLVGTFALSIALPLWLDPPSVMRRPLAARLTTMIASALVMTLAWRGLPLLIPVVGLSLYLGVGRRLAQNPGTATFGIEFWSAVVVAASLGWGLA
jgi:hypothetical protein